MGGTPNNRVSTQEFYQALLKNKDEMKAAEDRQNEARSEMERRIMDELKGVPTQVETNKDEIDRLRKENTTRSKRGYFWDGLNSLGVLVTAVLTALKGS